MTDSLNVNEWFRFAQMDFDAAKTLSAHHHPAPLEIVCYHCQQSAEKVLKAYAIAKGESLIKTHDLRVIIGQCAKHDEAFNSLAQVCLVLNDYAIITRYPHGEDAVTEHDMKTALKYAEEILEFTKNKLILLGYL